MPHIEPFEPVGKDGWVFHEKLDDFYIFKAAHTTNIRPGHAFTDGSYHSEFGCSGVVVLPGGLVYGCKPVGYQSAYKGETVALYLAAYYAEAGTTIHVDCKGVITSVTKGGSRVVLGEMVQRIRLLIQEKWVKVVHVKAHVGILGNEAADKSAQHCNVLVTVSPQQVPTNAFHVVYKGEKFMHPHKVWTKTKIPKHQQLDIWHVPFWPFRYEFQTRI